MDLLHACPVTLLSLRLSIETAVTFMYILYLRGSSALCVCSCDIVSNGLNYYSGGRHSAEFIRSKAVERASFMKGTILLIMFVFTHISVVELRCMKHFID